MKQNVMILVLMVAGLGLRANPDIKQHIRDSGTARDYPGKSELVLFDSTLVDVQETGLSYVTIHRLVKVLNSTGAKNNAVIIYGYDPLSAWVEFKKVVIHRQAGSSEELDLATVMDYPAPARAIYWGAREIMIHVGRLEPGDAVEVFLFRKGFTYALLAGGPDDDRYIPPMRGHFYDIVEFWSSEPVVEKVYQVSIPRDKLVQFEVYNGEVRTSVKPDGSNMVYTFTRSDFDEPPSEPGMVAKSDVFTKLLISTSPDWYAKSKWFYQVNEDYGSFESTPEIDRKVSEILKGAKNEMDSVSLLTHWVADNIRYSGISMGEGEGFTLHKGSMTFSDRCGVCKDKAGMLVTMLRSAGFESYAAMTMAGSRIDYIPADQFNHSVTVVKLSDGKYHILDPTWVPFVRELWSSLEQQQNYLMGLPGGADLMITPVSNPANHYLRITGTSEITKDGSLKGEFTLDAEGQSDAAIRRMFTGDFVKSWYKNLEKELLSTHPRMEIKKMEYGEPYQYLEAPLKIKVSYYIPNYAIVSEDEMLFTPLVVSGIFKRAMSHLYTNTDVKDRKYPFRDRCSREVELTETVKLPDETALHFVPETALTSGPGANFKGGMMLEGNILTVSAKMSFHKRVYEPDDWGSFREAVVSHKNLAEKPVIVKL